MQVEAIETYIIPPPPCTTLLITEEYLSLFLIPPLPKELGGGSYNKLSPSRTEDVDSDYYSVGDLPITPDHTKRSTTSDYEPATPPRQQGHRTAPVGASPPSYKEVDSNSQPELNLDERVTNRSRHHSANADQRNNVKLPDQYNIKPDQADRRVYTMTDEMRQSRQYSSLLRPSAAQAKFGQYRDFRGSTERLDKVSQPDRLTAVRPGLDDVRPASPRNESMMLGNLGFNSSDEDDNIKFEAPQRPVQQSKRQQPERRQTVLPDAHHALEYFIQSEKRYVADINSLLTVHVEPLGNQGCVNVDVVNSLRSSLLRLLHFHQRLAGDLDQCFRDTTVNRESPDYFAMVNYLCDCLYEGQSRFSTYINFCCTRAQLIRNISNMDDEEGHRWQQYAAQCNPSGDPAQSIEAGLAMPVQRIAEYPKLLSHIQERGAIRNGILAEKINITRAMLEGVRNSVNERLHIQQEFQCLYINNKKLEVLIGPIEELCHQSPVVEVKVRDYESFIPEVETGLHMLLYKKGIALVQRKKKSKSSFNKLLSGTQTVPKVEYGLKQFYPVSSLMVKDLPNTHVFEVADVVTQQKIVLASKSLDNKAQLMKGVGAAIQDYEKFLSTSLAIKESS